MCDGKNHNCAHLATSTSSITKADAKSGTPLLRVGRESTLRTSPSANIDVCGSDTDITTGSAVRACVCGAALDLLALRPDVPTAPGFPAAYT